MGLLLAAGTLFAQTTGTISGWVTDSERGAGLPGAQVRIPAIGYATNTNAQGEFTMIGVPAGSHSVAVEYLGLAPSTETAVVKAGARVEMRFRLKSPSVVVLEAFEVSGTVEGTGRALNLQRTAPNLMNIVSSDAIGQFPDPNVAEALQRAVGIGVQRDQGEGRYIQIRGTPAEFTSVTVDGVSVQPTQSGARRVDLDTIPSDVIDTLEITKALRSDQDADSIGGAVNITTQSAFTYEGLRVRGSIGHGVNELGDNLGDTRGSVSVSNRFGPQKNFGLLVSASYSKTRREVHNFETEWTLVDRPEGDEIMGIEDIDSKFYDSERTRRGATANLEWRPRPGHQLFLRGSFSNFRDYEQRNRVQILHSEGVLQRGATDRVGTVNGARLTKQLKDMNRFSEINNISAGGVHEIGTMKLDYTAALSRSENNVPHQREHLYRTSANVAATYDLTRDVDLPRHTPFETGVLLELNRYGFRENLRRVDTLNEEERSLAANLRRPFQFGERRGVAKVGGKIRLKERAFDREQYRDRAASAAPSGGIASVLGSKTGSNFDRYGVGLKFDTKLVSPFFVREYPANTRQPASDTVDYGLDEDISAAYALVELDYGKLDIFAGFRAERTEFSAAAVRQNEVTGALTPQRVKRSYTDLFPGVHGRYKFSDMFIVRGAITRSINRPNYTEIVPRAVETDDGTALRISAGNPNLKQTLSNNLDLGMEYYFKPMGLVSAGLFYKDLTDYRFDSRIRGTFDNRPAIFTRPENAKGGEIKGIELAYQQQFTFLPAFLSGFGLILNYTYTESEVTAPIINPATGLSDLSRKTRLPGQSENTYNAAIFYDKHGVNARLSYTARGDYLDSINTAGGARFDDWWVGRDQIDFTASYKITRRFQIFTEVKNLTDTRGIRYRGERRFPIEVEGFGYILFAGVKFTL